MVSGWRSWNFSNRILPNHVSPKFYPGKDWRICIMYWRVPICYLIIPNLETKKATLYRLSDNSISPLQIWWMNTWNNWFVPACWLCSIIHIFGKSHPAKNIMMRSVSLSEIVCLNLQLMPENCTRMIVFTQRKLIGKTGREVLELELVLEVTGAGCCANQRPESWRKNCIGHGNVHLWGSL